MTTQQSRPARRRRLAAALVAVLAVTGLVSTAADAAPSAAPKAAPAAATKDVIANLWEWNWPSVAAECTGVLGPQGYGGVQVAPPQDSLKRDYTSDDAPIEHPWWEVYQPADYSLTSRMGTEAQFRSMVTTCRAAGVKVYVDAVINHMTGQGDTSYGGRTFGRYDYDGLYSPNNFHKYSGSCPSASGGIEDYNNQQQVFNCELLGLADLRTDSGYVRRQIARYLNRLLSYGVSGFRVDAAKHVGEADLIAIHDRLHDTVDGDRPYWALEVFPGGPGVLSQTAFTRAGDVLGFDFAYQVKNAFKSYPTGATGNIAGLRVFGEDAGLVPSSKSLAFVENHDTERGSDTLSYKDGPTNVLANQFMLAYGYGTPQVYASFAWTHTYDSPPSTAAGLVTDTDCAKGWVCVDRDPAVTGLVAFHNHVGTAPVRHWYDDDQNLIAFSRGTRGWVALNNASTATTRTFSTGLPRGTYCDLSHGTVSAGRCSGRTVRVNARGRASVTVPAKQAVAIDTAALVRS